ncbi:metallo-beta-lactamase domain-containing protein 1 [Epargyreus clarus]|uniref:metallo-beta-lactamase domain-containing protein 1 n=1 Tax=Epargyreus clarus TaxID=520877 RepID=UPI003C2CD051
MNTMSETIVLYDGYSEMNSDDEMSANCSCTLITGPHNVIVDTMTAWDSELIINGLKKHNISPNDIHYVVSTHGHSDHVGNNNLFMKAKHIVGYSISHKDKYFIYPFDKGEEYVINDGVKVIPTPGHTMAHVSVLVTTKEGTVAIAGDLFEKFEDIENPDMWKDAGSEDPIQQRKNRSKVACLADWIVPGHGPKFQVTDQIRDALKKQASE